MFKIKVVLLALAASVLVYNFSYAKSNDCPPGQEKKGWKCIDAETLDTGNGSSSSASNQEQVQSNIVVTDITIKDNRQTVQTIIDFNHISPIIGKTSADMVENADTMDAKVISRIDNAISSITLKMSHKLGSDTKDFKMFTELMFENDFRTSIITKGAKGILMGTLTFVPTGSKCTSAGLSGRAYEAAMDAGATHYVLQYTQGIYMSGSKAGFDLGSAASVAAKSDGSAVVAPGATLGYSHAWSENEYRPGIVIALYFDDTMTITTVAKTQQYISR